MHTRILVACLVHFISVLSVNGVYLFLNPPYIVMGSSNVNHSMSVNVQCSSSETFNVGTFLQLVINQRKLTEPTIDLEIAFLFSNGTAGLFSNFHSEMRNRSPNITGSVDTGKKSGTMTLSMSAQGLTCSDQAQLYCVFTYLDSNQRRQTDTDIDDFTVITVPSEVIIDSPEYYNVNGNTQHLLNNSVLPAGTRIKYRCTANVGSVPDGEIIWERSSDMGTMDSFIPYTPTSATDIVQESSQQDGCVYRRTSTMYYNLTKLDEYGISFRCIARSYMRGQLYNALSNQQYRAVAGCSCLSAGPRTLQDLKGSNINSTPVVTIVLGLMVVVFAVVIVILSIYLRRYRQLAELESQEQSRVHTYVGLTETRQTSGQYNFLNVIPADGNVRLEESQYVDVDNNVS